MSSRLPERMQEMDPLLEKYQRKANYDSSGVLSWVAALTLLGIIGLVVAMTALALSVPPQAPQKSRHWTQRP